MQIVTALIAGILFGLGLAISQMIDPAKVLSFLDIAGSWDPSLILVMGGAVALTVPGFWLILKQPHPMFDKNFYVPDASHIDAKLLLGAALFGVGWGIGGLCPGPAFAALGTLNVDVIGFVIMMLIGYRLVCYLESGKGA